MRDKTGGSAFPTPRFTVDGEARFTGFSIHTDGMSLRDYFAAQAMTGMQIWDAVLNKNHAQFAGGNGGVELLAKTAYLVADAMLKAREE